MFCPACGKEVGEGKSFCTKCGASLKMVPPATNPIQDTKKTVLAEDQTGMTVNNHPSPEMNRQTVNLFGEAAPTPSPKQEPASAPVLYPTPSPKQKSRSKKILIIVLAAVFIIIAGILALYFLVIARRPTVELAEYCRVVYSGYNGYGTAEFEFDKEKFTIDYEDKIRYREEAGPVELVKAFFGAEADGEACEDFAEQISASPDKNSGIQSGESISLTWDMDTDALEEDFYVLVEVKEIKSKAPELSEPSKLDAFSDFELELSGDDGSGQITGFRVGEEIGDSDYFGDLSYSVSPSEELSNGDTVLVTVTVPKDFTEKTGMVLSETEKKITVDGFAAQSAAAEGQAAADASYIIPESDSRFISQSELSGLTDNECSYAIYEIYARHGVIFNDSVIQSYFTVKNWYSPKTPENQFSDSDLTGVERTNIATIQGYLASKQQTGYASQYTQPNIYANNSSYVLPQSSSYYISYSDLYGFDAWTCKVARNEIYARHGRRFNSQDLQSYFDNCTWYRGTISAESFSESQLNTVEKENIKIIQQYEKDHGFN